MIGDKVSLVVLTFNRCAELLRTLSRLADIDASVPIVVVDNASTDGTSDAVARLGPRVRIVRLSRNAGAAGRNASQSVTTTRGGCPDRSRSPPRRSMRIRCWPR